MHMYFLNSSLWQPVQKREQGRLWAEERSPSTAPCPADHAGQPQNRTFNSKLPRLCGTIDSQHKIKKALLWAQRERQEWCHKPMFCSQWRREIILIPSIPLSMPTTDLADATFVQVQSLFGSKQDRATKETLSIHPGSSKHCALSCPTLLSAR